MEADILRQHYKHVIARTNKYITNMILHDHDTTYVQFLMAANQTLLYMMPQK